MKDNVKNAIEKATIKASSAILAIVKTFDDHGAELSDDDALKVFRHLFNTVVAAQTRAMAARSVRLTETSSFSLDKTVERIAEITIATPIFKPPQMVVDGNTVATAAITDKPTTKTVIVSGDPAPQPTPEYQPRYVKPEGRLAGTNGKEIVYPTAESLRPRRVEVEPGEVPDKTGAIKDAGFLDA